MKLHKLVNNDSTESGRLLRIAMLIQCYHPAIGGAEKQLKSLVPFLQKENCQIHVFTRLRQGLAKTEMIDGAVVHRIPAYGPRVTASLSYTLGALARLKQLQPDVIHAHELLSPTTTAVAAHRFFGTPVVAKVLGGGCLGDLAKLKRSRWLGERRIKTYSRCVNKFITVSSEISNELTAAGVPPEQQCFIPNGVDTDRFVPVDAHVQSKRRVELQLTGSPIVLYTGRLAGEKRLEQ
jgi:glycosyltransferase involved in cell wall biosynthesis